MIFQQPLLNDQQVLAMENEEILQLTVSLAKNRWSTTS